MGDAACWLDQTCPDCGGIVADARPCPRCGLSAPRPPRTGATPATTRRNWAGSHTYRASALARPTSVEQVQELVASSSRLHALGSRHSFNDVSDTDGVQVTLADLPTRLDLDPDTATATVAGGLTYGDVVTTLDDAGWALPNLASLPHIGIAGATATGTHGSGDANKVLSAAVTAIELVDGTGQLRRVSRDDDPETFPGVVVHLGALGIVTALDLALVPARTMHQRVYVDLPADVLATNFDRVMGAADSVSCFTRWQDATVVAVCLKSTGHPDDDPEDLFGARRATTARHPIPGLPTDGVTEQLGVEGPWYDRLPHFRTGFTPSNGAEIQSEYFVARDDAVAAIEALWAIGPELDELLQVGEIRTIAADDLWLSPAHGRDTVGFHFTWRRRPRRVLELLATIEDALSPFGGTPHWGKAFTAGRDVFADRHDHLDDFARLVDHFDPEQTFRNAFLDAHVL